MGVLEVVLCLEVERQGNIGVVEDLTMVDLEEEEAVTTGTMTRLLVELEEMVDLEEEAVEVKLLMILYILKQKDIPQGVGVLEGCLQVMDLRADWVMLRRFGIVVTILRRGLEVAEPDWEDLFL
jgi:hypothetical protein